MNSNAAANNAAGLTPETELCVRFCRSDELPAVLRYFPALIAEPAGVTLVAWIGEEAVGHIQIRWRGSIHGNVRARLHNVPEIRRLRVHENSQRQGIGPALLEAAESLAVQRGFRSVGLAVGVTNLSALTLYDRSGYVRAGIAPFVSSMGLDEEGHRFDHTVQYMVKPIQMVKPLQSAKRIQTVNEQRRLVVA